MYALMDDRYRNERIKKLSTILFKRLSVNSKGNSMSKHYFIAANGVINNLTLKY